MRPQRRTRCLAALLPLLIFTLIGGCARNAPSENGGANALSGKRLQVSLTFRGNINPNYYYFFLINNSNSQNAVGPIPVGPPQSGQPYGNGFATGSSPGTSGFTDFVLYSANNGQYGAQAVSNYGLYHVNNGANSNDRTQFVPNGAPVLYFPPGTNGLGPNMIYFEIDLSQLYPTVTSQTQAVSDALSTRWMQVNLVSTNNTPTDTQTSISKAFDSFGDDTDGRGNFLLIDLTQTSPYVNGNSTLAALASEPSFNDVYVYPPGSIPQDPSLDLTDWTITISQQ